MKNPDKWHPTKYELVNGQLKGSRNPAYLFVGSRLIADLFAFCYDKMIPQYVHGSVCDLGCGFAPLYLKYKDYAEQITLVDWGNTFHKNIHLDVEADLNQPLPFDDVIFDSIILSDVLEHIYEPRQLLSEIARCLRMNGKLGECAVLL